MSRAIVGAARDRAAVRRDTTMKCIAFWQQDWVARSSQPRPRDGLKCAAASHVELGSTDHAVGHERLVSRLRAALAERAR
jgi:hypothetical protein